MKFLKFLTPLFALIFCFDCFALGKSQKLSLGTFKTRAILNIVPGNSNELGPLVILVPGSGAQGPEVMFPGRVTTDGKDHSIFLGFTEPLNRAGVSTLAIGKPGVDFFSGWSEGGLHESFYDKSMYDSLRWSDLVENVRQAVLFARTLPGIDSKNIYVLGHSESTQVVADYTLIDDHLAGVILFGVVNESFAKSDEYQVFDLCTEWLIAPSMDENSDGIITRAEESRWQNQLCPFNWWKPSEEKISIKTINERIRKDPDNLRSLEQRSEYSLRLPVYRRENTVGSLLANLPLDLFVYTGELDPMTPPQQALDFKKSCDLVSKKNCSVKIVPGLGHAFSKPKGDRQHPLLDFSFGPVDPEFKQLLRNLADQLKN